MIVKRHNIAHRCFKIPLNYYHTAGTISHLHKKVDIKISLKRKFFIFPHRVTGGRYTAFIKTYFSDKIVPIHYLNILFTRYLRIFAFQYIVENIFAIHSFHFSVHSSPTCEIKNSHSENARNNAK